MIASLKKNKKTHVRKTKVKTPDANKQRQIKPTKQPFEQNTQQQRNQNAVTTTLKEQQTFFLFFF